MIIHFSRIRTCQPGMLSFRTRIVNNVGRSDHEFYHASATMISCSPKCHRKLPLVTLKMQTNRNWKLCTSVIFIIFSSCDMFTFCDNSAKPKLSDVNTEDEEYDEEAEKKCSFCQFFLESQCKNQFKAWHACIKVSETATNCMEPFRPLKECMDEYGIVMGGQDDDDFDDRDDDNQ